MLTQNIEFYGDRRHGAGAWGRHKGAQDSPNHVYTTSTLAPRPRCKNIEFYEGRRQRRVLGADKKEPKTAPTTSTLAAMPRCTNVVLQVRRKTGATVGAVWRAIGCAL